MKKKIIYLSVILVLVISLITLSSIYKSKDNKYKKEYNTIPKGMAIMIKEEGATDYTKSTSKDIPKGNYVLNEEKTHCENNGKVTNYNSATGKISLNFIGSDRCYLYFDYEVLDGWKTILINNGNGATTVEEAKTYIEGRTTSTTPDFSTVATTNEGMYSAPDDLGTSYYFRGAVDNNWLKYGKYTKDMYNCNNGTISATDTGNSCTKIASSGDAIYWRIIRINGDNSIRMIYSGITPPTESTKVIKTTDTSLGKSLFNSEYDSQQYVGYMYSEGGIENSTSSMIKNYLEDWYANYTDLNATGTKITDQIFCNDRRIARRDPPDIYYGAGGRLSYNIFMYGKKQEPILTCPNESDKFTSKGSSIGNKKLEYPVGLITADEVSMAGGKIPTRQGETADNSSYYLYTNQTYWSGSPHNFNSGSTTGSTSNYSGAREFIVSSSGELDVSTNGYHYVVVPIPPEDGSDSGSGSDSSSGSGSDSDSGSGRFNGVRPVVSLSSKVKLSGNGTYSKPYTVS